MCDLRSSILSDVYRPIIDTVVKNVRPAFEYTYECLQPIMDIIGKDVRPAFEYTFGLLQFDYRHSG
jgi:hypothetical protein